MPTDLKSAFDRLAPASKLALASAHAAKARGLKNIPEQIVIGLTSRCNLACAHCRYLKNDWARPPGEMALKAAIFLLEQTAAAGIPKAVFFGGEPTLYPGLEKLVKKSSALGLFTELDTNGALLDRTRVQRLKRAGLSAVMISLHGRGPAEHDLVAGSGTFKKTAAAIKLCSGSGLITYVSACVFNGRGKAVGAAGLLRTAGELGAHGARLLPYAGRRGGPDAASNRGILALTRRPGAHGFARTCLLSAASCDASQGRLIYVSPDGIVTPCPYAKISSGDLKEETLLEIIKKNRVPRKAIFC